jgi:iron(II)-dependent oxidoreductase
MKKQHLGSIKTLGILTVFLAMPVAAIASDAASDGKSINYNEMVNVPAGKFIYGKIHAKQEINLPAFKIDKYEVTNEQYAKIVLDHKYYPEEIHMPAVFVSQDEAADYCNSVDKRLPSEEEWEKAARGTDGRLYPWGNKFDEAAAVTSETADGKVSDVGTREKGKSPYGAMDMAGNVWEWTTGFDERYIILRGGSFYEESWASQVVSKLSSIPEDGKDYIGFRCVKGGK